MIAAPVIRRGAHRKSRGRAIPLMPWRMGWAFGFGGRDAPFLPGLLSDGASRSVRMAGKANARPPFGRPGAATGVRSDAYGMLYGDQKAAGATSESASQEYWATVTGCAESIVPSL